jgi:hypothetical protein
MNQNARNEDDGDSVEIIDHQVEVEMVIEVSGDEHRLEDQDQFEVIIEGEDESSG